MFIDYKVEVKINILGLVGIVINVCTMLNLFVDIPCDSISK